MTVPEDDKDPGAAEADAPEDEAMRALVRRALEPHGGDARPPSLLGGVQKRIRRRSRGKFFGDGWSTGQARFGHVMVALVTLLLVVLAYFGLGPMGVR